MTKEQHDWRYQSPTTVSLFCLKCGATWLYHYSIMRPDKAMPDCEPDKYGPYFDHGQYAGRFLREPVESA